ncbi:hypothetical protein [Hyphomicrobium facile]|uniref:Uncharacterized protein n=1 Tax=Hyphomicrobium facile TaxID=51670 RepID=A0A1I7NE08_9HYPH|nr:hypothetical protein [Hyphomicrobium facile]SFV32917.1 hypothetical protein SAMN04488557_1772 [Hyphomicrobium facile]
MNELYIRSEAHDGRLLGWEQSLANFAMSEVVKAATDRAFVVLHRYSNKPCLLFSEVTTATVMILAMYDLAPQVPWLAMARGRYDLLLGNWEQYCSAFLAAEFRAEPTPFFLNINAAASNKSVAELETHWCSEFPALSEIDENLGSSLVASSSIRATMQPIDQRE